LATDFLENPDEWWSALRVNVWPLVKSRGSRSGLSIDIAAFDPGPHRY
jgi:hypothetical protein